MLECLSRRGRSRLRGRQRRRKLRRIRLSRQRVSRAVQRLDNLRLVGSTPVIFCQCRRAAIAPRPDVGQVFRKRLPGSIGIAAVGPGTFWRHLLRCVAGLGHGLVLVCGLEDGLRRLGSSGRPLLRGGGFQAIPGRPSSLIGIPFDRPVVGYGGRTINTLRLWAAAAPDSKKARRSIGFYPVSVRARRRVKRAQTGRFEPPLISVLQ